MATCAAKLMYGSMCTGRLQFLESTNFLVDCRGRHMYSASYM